jgi:hypothetical protein
VNDTLKRLEAAVEVARTSGHAGAAEIEEVLRREAGRTVGQLPH